MKVGRPLSEDKAYALEMGVDRRLVKSLGGAEKLKKLAPEVRALLLKPAKVVLVGRQMPQDMRCKTNTIARKDEFVESVIQATLRKRGLA